MMGAGQGRVVTTGCVLRGVQMGFLDHVAAGDIGKETDPLT